MEKFINDIHNSACINKSLIEHLAMVSAFKQEIVLRDKEETSRNLQYVATTCGQSLIPKCYQV